MTEASSMTDLSSMSGDLPSMGGDLPSMTDAQSTGCEPTTGRPVRRMLMAGMLAAGGMTAPATAGVNISPSHELTQGGVHATLVAANICGYGGPYNYRYCFYTPLSPPFTFYAL